MGKDGKGATEAEFGTQTRSFVNLQAIINPRGGALWPLEDKRKQRAKAHSRPLDFPKVRTLIGNKTFSTWGMSTDAFN